MVSLLVRPLQQKTVLSGIKRAFVIGLFWGLAVGSTQAGNLTTFEEYARMSPEEQSDLRAYAASVIFKQALTENDTERVACLRYTYSSKYGPKSEVKLAHARLRGVLEAAVEAHDDDSRVEYTVAHYLKKVCPPTKKPGEQ